jgi:hypothetical protein
MTLGEFRRKTEDLPDGIELFMDDRKTEFRYELVNSIMVKDIKMTEDPDGGGASAIETVLVLNEE